MYRSLSGYGSRPPSPPPHTPRRLQHSLTIQTVNQQSTHTPSQQQQQHQHGTSSSPPQQAYPSYPLPIPLDKQAKARKLHQKYLMEVKLDQSKREPQSAASYHNPYLNVPGVPGVPAPRSVTSHASSRHNRATSISTSTFDVRTELSSVVSFDGDESPSSANAKAKGELISFDGKPVKTPRIRRRLSSVKRAKAALVRHLGSCWVCHQRKVPCPLDHHDLDSLHQLTPQGNRSLSQTQFPGSSATSSQRTDISLLGGEDTSLSFSQSDVLAGIQGNAGLDDLGPIAATLDIQSPGAYGDTQLPTPATINYVAPALPTIGANPYGTYQNGDMVAIGLRDGFYWCQHLDGLCNAFFNTDEELQTHFQLAHFEFTRINPAYRYICLECKHLNNDLNGLCFNCGAQESIQLWVYGQYIRIPNYHRQAPDGQDLQRIAPYSVPFSAVSFQNFDFDLGLNDFDGNANAGGFDMQDDNLYGGPGNQAYGYNPSRGSDAGGSQYQGSVYGARQMAMNISNTIRVGYMKSLQFFNQHKPILLLLSVLIVISFEVTFKWLLSKAEGNFPQTTSTFQTHLPLIGFLAIMGSFLLSLSVKYFAAKHLRRTQCVSIIVVRNGPQHKANEAGRDDVLFMLSRTLLSPSSADHQHLILISLAGKNYDKKSAHLKNYLLSYTPAMNHVL